MIILIKRFGNWVPISPTSPWKAMKRASTALIIIMEETNPTSSPEQMTGFSFI